MQPDLSRPLATPFQGVDQRQFDPLRNGLREQAGLELMDEPERSVYPTPLNTEGDDRAFVGRLRVDQSHERGLIFWCVSDNLRKGAATNALQIAEELIRRGKL